MTRQRIHTESQVDKTLIVYLDSPQSRQPCFYTKYHACPVFELRALVDMRMRQPRHYRALQLPPRLRVIADFILNSFCEETNLPVS